MTDPRRIVLASDHNAVELRRAIGSHLEAAGWDVLDIGPVGAGAVDYPQQGVAAARLVAAGDCRFGIVMCGTGQGIMMAANKVRGIRCGVCADVYSAGMIRRHNDANMLSIGARVVGQDLALEIVDAFVQTAFEGGRHAARVAMIRALEDEADG